ncbi:MYB DNA-binding domain-containing protein [Colletotrichum orchidophilum]|uniref:MYB DNA-binding domain-containing protein n=1 Tax=Colletotrichum orchidophilum TaxID=1209926 RepID=A0A1G4BGC1_9PEZI|nr:MYB DNA-binding domain-containing protein [Colletotrichum orchidophilum]OHF00405.1 MYB DNA-binding domain-containing protein [Colletotrichum orchidophilum]
MRAGQQADWPRQGTDGTNKIPSSATDTAESENFVALTTFSHGASVTDLHHSLQKLPFLGGVEQTEKLARVYRAHDTRPYPTYLGGQTVTVDIASLLKAPDSDESSTAPPQHTRSSSDPSATATTAATAPVSGLPPYGPPPVAPGLAVSGKRAMPPHVAESPAKKQSKWSPEEDALIIELRGSGMKWEDISKRLPGRSAISCRLHYQNYLERRSEWDEERKNKLARLYERYDLSPILWKPLWIRIVHPEGKQTNTEARFKPEMWAKVAEEMAVPWRAAEAMHWQLGEADMARRAGVVPFSLTAVNVDQPGGGHRHSPSRGHMHTQSQPSLPRDIGGPSPRYGRPPPPGISPIPGGRAIAARRESVPGRPLMGSDPNEMAGMGPGGPGLAPIQGLPPGRGGGMLPGVAELTTGVSPYSTPAYAMGGIPTASPVPSARASPGPLLPALHYPPPHEQAGAKRRASPGTEMMGSRETSRRRHMDPRQEEMDRRRVA